ncbi:site-2 protease family protein [Novosphingobium sp. TH158]|uniref:site-2 protease family protein n=1 Tax=Novosphingobium sp. TH158 TaxID=2067455 RepID=UPI000C7AE8F3|nr:site-2 protease family protein [Novosphingobium sp. TH158]PLK26322.1 site-2 protease family protein [Novosphingobium sp. TH158]
MNDTLLKAAALIVPMVFAIVFHEVAHGLAAKWLGDPTAQERGRLSLNPIRHVDPVGTVVLPGALALMGLPVFGWAKPVPVVPQRMRNPRLGMMLSAAAGPASNFIQALVGAVLLGLLVAAYGSVEEPGEGVRFLVTMLSYVLMINVFIGLFNLIPVPPFDGSHIVEGLLPRPLAQAYGSIRGYGLLLVLLVIVVLPYLIPGFDPVGAIIDKPFKAMMDLYGAVVKGIAGA